jgi:glycolate oxidase FAD binding subunit
MMELRQGLEDGGGSLAVLRCPSEMKPKLDVWGSAGDLLPVMNSVKAQFDPAGLLNPGRFLGGI